LFFILLIIAEWGCHLHPKAFYCDRIEPAVESPAAGLEHTDVAETQCGVHANRARIGKIANDS
jgi:hypothetical protein